MSRNVEEMKTRTVFQALRMSGAPQRRFSSLLVADPLAFRYLRSVPAPLLPAHDPPAGPLLSTSAAPSSARGGKGRPAHIPYDLLPFSTSVPWSAFRAPLPHAV